MKVTLASSNTHKAEELSTLLAPVIQIIPAEIKLDVPETGTSFHENALIKAQAYYERMQSPTLSDDSGLILEAFPHKLGIYSARFAPEFPEYPDKCKEVLKLYEQNPDENRKAYFTSVICLYLNPGEIYFFEGRCQGTIAKELIGLEGFGYDPIFIPENNPNHSFASDTSFKNKDGHRAKAIQALLEFQISKNRA